MAEKQEPFSGFKDLSVSEDLVSSPSIRPPQLSNLDFGGLLDPPLCIQSDETECGGQLWPAGMALAEYLLRNEKEELMGKTILAITLGLNSSGFSNTIHLTDGSPVLIPLIGQNIALNEPNIRNTTLMVPSVLKWGQPLPDHVPQHPDILLAADCCYFEPSFPLLLETMEKMIGEDTLCYFSYKKRRRADKDMIRMLTRKFEVEEIDGNWQRDRVCLYIVWRRDQDENPVDDEGEDTRQGEDEVVGNDGDADRREDHND